MDPLEGKMDGAQPPASVSTRLQRIADMAREHPDRVFTNLAHHIDLELLLEAHRRTRKDAAAGVDGQSAAEYAVDLEANLQGLLNRVREGRYRAPAVRRVHIPKDDKGNTRPIGIPTFEDRVLQRAVAMVMNAVYEQDFLDCSYGFRPGRSAHQALDVARETLRAMNGGWVVEVDIRKFFDNLDHQHLRDILDMRVRDKTIRRLIGKWLKAGVLEGTELSYPDAGTPQGGVISPLLANVYLHHVLDRWFAEQVRPLLKGRPGRLIRYADDFIIICSRETDARAIAGVLPKRFGRFGLAVNEEKSRLIRFHRPPVSMGASASKDETFDFLGFTFHWRRARSGDWAVFRRTAGNRLKRSLKSIKEWCRANRHLSVSEQAETLGRKLRGHYNYFGVTGNYEMLNQFYRGVQRTWRKWLGRRSQRATIPWGRFSAMLARLGLPAPRVVRTIFRAANP